MIIALSLYFCDIYHIQRFFFFDGMMNEFEQEIALKLKEFY